MTRNPARTALMALVLVLPLAGCAGGWRDGVPPGPATSAAAGAASMTASPAASTAPAGASHGTADGAVFVWKGGGGSANVAGEFNAWNTSADAMTKQSDGSFTLSKKLEPGRYAYKFVIDGTNWKEDPTAAETVDDGFGGKNAIVVVGGAASAAPAAAAKPAAPAAPVAGGAGTRETKDGVLFVWKGGGNTAHVAGEFNGWNTSADAMTRQADGSFTLLKPLAPGRYPYKFVVDGGTWKEDPTAAETVDDGFGGKNAVAVVTGGGAGAAPAPAAAANPAATAAPAAGGAGTRETKDGVLFVWKGGGNTAHVAGEFNGWNTSADAMTRQADGSFTLLKPLAPGRYPYKFVVDGGTWKEDPTAAETVDDGFGGKNAVAVVTGGAAPAAPAAAAAPATSSGAVTGKAKPPAQSAAGVTFTCASAAKTVHLAGDFNAWSTTSDPFVRQADGTWAITRKIPAGTYSYKFVVDGTTWKTDDANPTTRDDGFGGKNSVVTVK